MSAKKEQFDDDIDFIEDEDGTNLQKVKAQLKRLRAELKACNEERQNYLTGWQRAQADLVNERREHVEKAGKTRKSAQEDLLYELLPVLDSFEMAFANKEAWEKVDKNWRAGIEHIYANLISILKLHGFSTDSPLGELFDPTLHESVEMIEVEDSSEDNIILEVLQKGYLQNGTVVRPAKVKVAVYPHKEEAT